MLNPIERDILTMRLVEDVPECEVAEMLAMTARHVRRIQRAALAKVRGDGKEQDHGTRHRTISLTPKLARYL